MDGGWRTGIKSIILNPDIENEQAQKLEELIKKFLDTFSESDYQLGCFNLIEHRIDVAGATLVKPRAY